MPKSNSKRRKVVDAERTGRQQQQTSQESFNRKVRGDNRLIADANGYVEISLDNVPPHQRGEFEAVLHQMGRHARIYRKPDGSISIMA